MTARDGRDVTGAVRGICLALPETTELLSHGSPNFFIRRSPCFVTVWPEGHHDHDFAHLWCAAAPGEAEALVAAGSPQLFRPPYVGHRGWLGVRLDGAVDWVEVGILCEAAYRALAPAALVAALGPDRR